jgi:transposase InsO family protein
MIEELLFPFQRIQTDQGQEFFGYEFQEKLMRYGIKFRSNKPAFPHLNGKAERSQKTDLEELWARVDLKDPKLEENLVGWRDYYNHYQLQAYLKTQTPWERWKEQELKTLLYEEAEAMFDPSKERIKLQNFWATL